MIQDPQPPPRIHLIGFGSQGSAWAQCLKTSGWQTRVYLPQTQSTSWQKAQSLGFEPRRIQELGSDLMQDAPSHPHALLALLCPDSQIPIVYETHLKDLPLDLCLILAHGFALYSSDLQLRGPHHRAALLAPKAIGPKLLENFQRHQPTAHGLSAAFYAPGVSPPNAQEFRRLDDPTPLEDFKRVQQVALGLGFQPQNLIPASFEQETIGDLISEQGLLCGGIFNLLLETFQAMDSAGIPRALIWEECVTELELIAGLIRSQGLSKSFQAISQAAQCGTLSMGESLQKAGLRDLFQSQAQWIREGGFAEFFKSGEWKGKAQEFTGILSHWESKLRTDLEPIPQTLCPPQKENNTHE